MGWCRKASACEITLIAKRSLSQRQAVLRVSSDGRFTLGYSAGMNRDERGQRLRLERLLGGQKMTICVLSGCKALCY
jgi:hypothetical protein